MVRIVFTTVASPDVPPEYADAVRNKLDAALALARRRSFTKDAHGQRTADGAVISYKAPDTGEEVWAHFYGDESVGELEEYESVEEAESAYEGNVRALAACVGFGEEWWQETDVEGVPVRLESSDEEDR